MMRRQILSLAVGLAALYPLAAPAQQQPVRVVGFLGANTPSSAGHMTDAFIVRMRELNWIEGRSLRIEYRWAAGQTATMGALARELVAAGAEVIVTSGDATIRAARNAAPTTPIVMASSAYPIEAGLIKSEARPGGTVTGMTFAAGETAAKRMELLKEVIPDLRRVIVLFNPDANPSEVLALRQSAPNLGISLEIVEFRTLADLDRIAALPDRPSIGAMFVVSDPLVFTNRIAINRFALHHRLPTMHRLQEYAIDGGLMSYGPDFVAYFRRAADYVDKIFKGATPDSLPVERPTVLRLIVNLRTARTLGVAIPEAILTRADDVIE